MPLNRDAVLDTMPALFDLLRAETEPFVRAVLGHFIFVYIHPYMDGNGRVGRFLMNVMMASGGYPWTSIPVENRTAYMYALEKATVGEDIAPFADFVAGLVEKRLAGEPLLAVPKSSSWAEKKDRRSVRRKSVNERPRVIPDVQMLLALPKSWRRRCFSSFGRVAMFHPGNLRNELWGL